MLHISRNKRYLLYRRCSFVLFAFSAHTSCNAHKNRRGFRPTIQRFPRSSSRPRPRWTAPAAPPPACPNNISDKNGAPAFMCRRCAVSGVAHLFSQYPEHAASQHLFLRRNCRAPHPPRCALHLRSTVRDRAASHLSPCIHDPFPDEPLPLDSPHGRVSL